MHSGPAVAVVGGGIIGLSAAWRLAQGGAAVTVFDAGRIGSESSWAGAGMLAPGGEYSVPTFWSALAQESLALYPDFVEELEAESRIDIDFRICGAFDIALAEPEAAALRMRADGQSAMGIYSEQFPPSRVPGLTTHAVAVQYFPYEAVVNPRDVVRALQACCQRAGVQFREREAVQHIASSGAVNGEPFDRVVISAGAWSSTILATLAREAAQAPLSGPVKGHLIAFDEHTGLCDAIIRRGSTYLLRRGAAQVITGASTEHKGFDRALDGIIAAALAEQAAELVPALSGLKYATWNGFRPGTTGGEPALGRLLDTSVWLAYGHYRNGILLAPATASRIAGQILERELTPANSQTGSFSPIGYL